ncbi:TPA: hypothetical protein ACH3X1_010107 [Trebouxia sp. C0004]
MPGLRGLPRTVSPVSLGGSAEQTLSLLTRPLSKDLPARHIASIRHLCTEYSKGCTLGSLPTIRKILEIVLQNVRTSNAGPFVEVACELLRLLADTQTAGVIVAALKHALSRLDASPALSSDFSIAAVQPSPQLSVTSTAVDQSPVDLPTALLHAAVAFSTSKRLCEQLLSAGVKQPIALVLNQGGVHDHHTSLAVELLWNLLEACPQADPAVHEGAYMANSTLTARHSKLVRFPQAKPSLASKQASGSLDDIRGQASFSRPDTAKDEGITADSDTPKDNADGAGFETSCEVDSMRGTLGSAIEAESLTGSQQDSPDLPAAQPLDQDTGALPTVAEAEAADIHGTDCCDTDDSIGVAETDAQTILGLEGNMTLSPADDGEGQQSTSEPGPSSVPDASHSNDSTVEAGNLEAGAASGTEAGMAATWWAQSDAHDQDAIDAHSAGQSVAAGIVRVFGDCLANGYSKADKELRNTVLVVVGLLAQSRHYRDALCCDAMLQHLLLVCTEPELGGCSTAYLKASSQAIDAEDFEMRQLAWTCMTQLLLHKPAAVNSLAYSFVRVVLMYVQSGKGLEEGPLHWSKPQLATLRHAALGLLHSLAPCFPQAYDECGGPALMLQFLAGCTDSKLLAAGLHHMHRACSASALLCGIWGGQGSMELALAVAADTTWPVRVRRTALLLVSVLSRGSPQSAKHFLLLGGTATLCLELEKLKLMGSEAATLYDFAVLDALWSGIVQSPAALQSFLLADGLGTLLDLLDCGAAALKPLLLTIIADVLGSECGRHVKAPDILYEWLSSNQQSACHVMLDLWRQEEVGNGISSPATSPRSKLAPVPMPGSSEDLFMKIHAIFAQLGFASAAAHMDLPDQATLCAAEQYFALQQGLVWRNMAAKFAAEGLDPTGEDKARIKAGIERAAEISRCVAEKQQQLLQQHADQLMQAELDFVRHVYKLPPSLPLMYNTVQPGFV